jgi:hypothetical protein
MAMNYFVIYGLIGQVSTIAYFPKCPGFDAKLAAENYAKSLCKELGINFTGEYSFVHAPFKYVQILEQ